VTTLRAPGGWEVDAVVLDRGDGDGPQPQFRVKRYGYLVGRYPDFPGPRTAEQVKHLMGEAFAHLKEES
jgi:hypothetical protein